MAIEMRYHRQGGGFYPSFLNSIEIPVSAALSNDKTIFKNSLVVECKTPLRSEDTVINAIKEALSSLNPNQVRVNLNKYLAVSKK